MSLGKAIEYRGECMSFEEVCCHFISYGSHHLVWCHKSIGAEMNVIIELRALCQEVKKLSAET